MNFKEIDIETLNTNQQIDLICERLEAYHSANPTGKLSYSGGRDSNLLFHIIRNVLGLNNTDFEAVYIDTKNEFYNIKNHLQEQNAKYGFTTRTTKYNCLSLFEKYGMPLFSKQMSKNIYLYLRNNESITKNETLKKDIIKKAEFVSNNNLRCNDKCCYYLKEKHLKDVHIVGLRKEEGGRRALYKEYDFCVTNGKLFKPIFDLKNESLQKIEKTLNIKVPEIYCYLDRTGCVLCGYGTKQQFKDKLNYLQIFENKRFQFYRTYFYEYLKYRNII